MYQIEIISHHTPHQCRCVHNPLTEVTRQDLTSNLLKHNPNLLKYLGKPINTQPQPALQPYITPAFQVQPAPQLYVIPAVQPQPTPAPILPVIQQAVRQVFNQTKPHTSPKKAQQKCILESKQVAEYYKRLKNQSRYLSNTGFKKYFDRQIFENFGRNNTHDHNDRFVNDNYLKTHNIIPHTGTASNNYHFKDAISPPKIEVVKSKSRQGRRNIKSRQHVRVYKQGKKQQLKASNTQERLQYAQIKHSEPNQQQKQSRHYSTLELNTKQVLPAYNLQTTNKVQQSFQSNNIFRQDPKVSIIEYMGSNQKDQLNQNLNSRSQYLDVSRDGMISRERLKQVILEMTEKDPEIIARVRSIANESRISQRPEVSSYQGHK